jgi:tetratricopeptide (TPR) repeat protein
VQRSRHLTLIVSLTGLLIGLGVYNAHLFRTLAGLPPRRDALQAQLAPGGDGVSSLAGLASLPPLARERSPEVLDALSRVAARLAQSGNAAAAETVLRRGIEVAPHDGYPHYAYSVFLRQQAKHEHALDQARRAAELSPHDPRITLQLGLAYFDLNRRSEAEAEFRRVLALDPDQSDAYLGLAYVNHTPSRYRKAIEYAHRFTRMRPRANEGHVMLARLYLDLRQYQQALASARTATRLRATDGAAWHLVGLAQAGDPNAKAAQRSEAVESFRRAVQLDPDFAVSHYELGRLYLQTGRTGEAIRELREALEIWPGNGSYHWTLMQALRKAGDAEGARREAALARHYTRYKEEQERLSQRIQDHPGSVEYYEELARLHLEYRQNERAARVLRDALAIAPGSPRLRNLMVRAGEIQPAPGGTLP